MPTKSAGQDAAEAAVARVIRRALERIGRAAGKNPAQTRAAFESPKGSAPRWARRVLAFGVEAVQAESLAPAQRDARLATAAVEQTASLARAARRRRQSRGVGRNRRVTDILSPADIGAALGVSVRSPRRWVLEGRLRGHRLGDRRSEVRVKSADLEVFLVESKLGRRVLGRALRRNGGRILASLSSNSPIPIANLANRDQNPPTNATSDSTP
jgi:hypothetical protein